MPDQDRIRILRIVEYVGPRDWVEKTVRNSIHGSKTKHDFAGWPEGAAITAVTLREFGESIAGSMVESASKLYTCDLCGRKVPRVSRSEVRRKGGENGAYWDDPILRCDDCLESIRAQCASGFSNAITVVVSEVHE